MWKKLFLAIALTCGIAVTGCGETVPVATLQPTATATIPPTGTLPADAQCPGQNDKTLKQYLDSDQIFIPANAVLTSGSYGAADGVQYSNSFQLFNVCIPLATPSQITSLYQVNMPINGWQMSSTFPYVVDITAPCKTICWIKTLGKLTHGIALENIALVGHKTVFVIRDTNFSINQ